ncbi:hydrolase [Alteromonas stellipolaris]|jgi:predicted alpha/beta-fold hydrolase|uniref:Hydrolase n=1 Tax=Alteromonas stellipolaris TaxID=233316 RepID=A0AAW7Z3G0_9ALTE|nr:MULTISPECIES: hydrolase [Alteromonas]AMJ92404.1 alpha/beta hydrolase [Alteromonas sp. Mac2]AMJ88551.1 alpha/beta hydrolase [Alteromonas sp. Mac1]AMJ96241.1 alpha/beta hydrolase [Alteromonas stellipolaris]MBZ2160959.1 hydrolase [Alteromonas stellipolaris]MDO6533539.1 hydrolase [Alteromonas stellipolaris]
MSKIALSHGKIIKSSFRVPSWAKNRHVQTIWPRFIQKRLPLKYSMERLTLPDDDFVDVAWGPKPAEPSGIIVMFHGLEGSIRSHYANDMMANLSVNGWQVVMMHYRGCSGVPNLKPRGYHSGETGDPSFFLDWLNQKFPQIPKVAVGFSLGGNMLLKLLGENPAQKWLNAAIAISSPLKLSECAKSINHGFSRVYQKYLLNSIKTTLRKKMSFIDYRKLIQLTGDDVDSITSFAQFDEKVTAPLHGFEDANDYYEKCSAYHFLSAIHCPTLVLHSIDDPFMNHLVVPKEEELARNVTLELSERGGHVGFMQGSVFSPKVWLHERVKRYVSDVLPINPNTPYV